MGRHGNFDKEVMEAAVEAVLEGKSSRKAAAEFDLNYKTLQRYVKRRKAEYGLDNGYYDEVKPRRHGNAKSSGTGREMSSFLSYLQRKGDTDRALRQKELDLRKEELELHKQEMELLKSRSEYDQVERQVHLDLLKAQMEAFTRRPGRLEDNQAKWGRGNH